MPRRQRKLQEYCKRGHLLSETRVIRVFNDGRVKSDCSLCYKRNQMIYGLKRYYNLSLDDYQQLLEQQNGLCAICKCKPTKQIKKEYLGVDHDHKTKRIRGLLCSNCNTGIGLFNDDPLLLVAAANYLSSQGQAEREGLK